MFDCGLPDDAEADAGLAVGAQRGLADVGPSVTVATSPSRFWPPIMSALERLRRGDAAVARTIRSWLFVVSEPAGVSKAIDASALRMSATVSPKLASFAWSMSTRKIFSRSP